MPALESIQSTWDCSATYGWMRYGDSAAGGSDWLGLRVGVQDMDQAPVMASEIKAGLIDDYGGAVNRRDTGGNFKVSAPYGFSSPRPQSIFDYYLLLYNIHPPLLCPPEFDGEYF